MDEVRELRGITDKKDRRVVADHVVIAVLGVKLEGKAARVAGCVGGAELAGHRREACNRLGSLALLEEHRLGELRDVFSGLEEAMGAPAFGVHDALGDPLSVERLHLLDDVAVLEQDWAVRADRKSTRLNS